MPRLADYLNKPEYLFRPSQVVRRTWRSLRTPRATEEVLLPWGLRLSIRPAEAIGRAIWTTGVYDLAVSEALWRLAERGETAVDAGANIGQMTSLLAARLGPAGTVYAFEPHPEVFADLSANAVLWGARTGVAQVRLHQVGLSDVAREGALVEGTDFRHNRGTARVEPVRPGGRRIRLTMLDEELGSDARIGVLKVDVEGHEGPLFRGARRLLSTHNVRDVIYEELSGVEGVATSILTAHGYHVFRILKGLFGPLLAPTRGHESSQAFAAPSYLATTEPERAVKRLGPRGWRCFHRSSA